MSTPTIQVPASSLPKGRRAYASTDDLYFAISYGNLDVALAVANQIPGPDYGIDALIALEHECLEVQEGEYSLS